MKRVIVALSVAAVAAAGCGGGGQAAAPTTTGGTATTGGAAATTTASGGSTTTGGNGGTGTSAGETETCKVATQQEIAGLFERWNGDLKSGDAKKVVTNYAPQSLLLPTMSSRARYTVAEKEDYFVHFLAGKPSGVVNQRWISVGCNTAVDAGVYTFTNATDGSKVPARYTFTYEWDGERWVITSHHSSAMPEAGADTALPAATAVTSSPAASTKGTETCQATSDQRVEKLFDTWSTALKTGDPTKVVGTYDNDSVLLPTVSNKVRFSPAEKEDYFKHFQEKNPIGTIVDRWTDIGCNTAVASGNYTFTYKDGSKTEARFTYTYRWNGSKWVITSHHSSAVPAKA